MKNGQLKPGYNIQTATTNQYVVDFACILIQLTLKRWSLF